MLTFTHLNLPTWFPVERGLEGRFCVKAKEKSKSFYLKSVSILRLFFVLGLFFSYQSVFGQAVGDYRSVKNGNWGTLGTWERLNSLPNTWDTPTQAQGYPGQNAGTGTVIIRNGDNVTLNISPTYNIGALVVGEALNTSANLVFGGSFTLNVTGKVDITGNNNKNLNLINVESGTLNVLGNLQIGTGSTINGDNGNRQSFLVIGSGTVNIEGDLIFTLVSGTENGSVRIVYTGTGLLNLKGIFRFTGREGGAITGDTKDNFNAPTQGTFNYNGGSSQIIRTEIGAINYFNLNINNTSPSGATLGAVITSTNVLGNISVGNVNSGSLLNTNNFGVTRPAGTSLTVAAGSTLNAGISSISWLGATGSTAVINGTFLTSNTNGFSGGTGTAISSTNGPSITLGNTSSINYNALGNQTVTQRTYNGNLTLSGSGTKIAAGVITVSGKTSLSGVTFLSGSTNGFTSNLGSLEINSSSTIALGSGNHGLNFSNSSAETWIGNISISNWAGTAGSSGTAGKVFFGTTASGLTSNQLSRISFSGNSPVATILPSGEVVPTPTPVITSALTASSTYGTSAGTYQITATNSPTAFNATWEGGSLPNGMSIDSSGQISIGPTTPAGTYTIRISATNAIGTGTADLTYTVNKAPLTITANNQSVCFGTPVANVTSAGTFTATGFVNAETVAVLSGIVTYTTTYSSTSPAGSTGLTITPVLSGLSAANYNLSPVSGTVTVNALPSISSQSLTGQSVCTTGTFSPISVSATGTGLTYQWYSNTSSINSGGSLISGATSASFTPPISTVDVPVYYYAVVSGTCSPSVTSAVSGPFVVTGDKSVGPELGSSQVCVNSSLGSPITHTTKNATGIGSPSGLPAGVVPSFNLTNQTITISGTPTQVGTFTYSIPILGCGPSVFATGTIQVNRNTATATTATTQTSCIGSPIQPITYTTTGATGVGTPTNLPAGVTASWFSNTLTISGTPTVPGTFNYSIPLTGGCGTVNATGTITVTQLMTASAPSISPAPICSGSVLPTITHTTTRATGIEQNGVDTGVNGLPEGVSASWLNNTITISGTPTESGVFNYSIPLTGGCGEIFATGTIEVRPKYELTSVRAIAPSVPGTPAIITLTGDPIVLPNGRYTVTYDLSGGQTSTTTATVDITDGVGSFSSVPITSSQLINVIIISLLKSDNPCPTSITSNNTTFFGKCSTIFNSDGQFFVPDGVKEITIRVYGGGGAGGTRDKSKDESGGGGGGAFSQRTIAVTPGEEFDIFVGKGGIPAGIPGVTATDGGASYVIKKGSDPSISNSIIFANGGKSVVTNSPSGALGGAALTSSEISSRPSEGSVLTLSFPGGNGSVATTKAGGGGSSAGDSGAGVNANGQRGAKAPVGGGNGGNGGSKKNEDGFLGTSPGGGGGGADSDDDKVVFYGGNGGDGLVIISFSCPENVLNVPCPVSMEVGTTPDKLVLKFDGPCSWTIPAEATQFDILVLGGGGGGGAKSGGGGGAGGLIHARVTDLAAAGIKVGDQMVINLGAGGVGAQNKSVGGSGGATTVAFGSILRLSAGGGGGGGSDSNPAGLSGSANTKTLPSAGVSILKDFAGSSGGEAMNPANNIISARVSASSGGKSGTQSGGGGGGAGSSGSSSASNILGGGGGAGVQDLSIFGSRSFAAGGGGGSNSFFSASGGSNGAGGSGGKNSSAINGNMGQTSGSGGGGAGFNNGRGGNGAAGAVIVSVVLRVLPVEMAEFEVKYDVLNRKSVISWGTAKEWESSHFEIYRSINGVDNWKKIGEEKGMGYSDSPTYYSFQDKNLPASGGNIFYRLKQVDFSGKFSYSVTRAIQVEAVAGARSWIIYPNPTSGVNFQLELANSEPLDEAGVTVILSNTLGQTEQFRDSKLDQLSLKLGETLQNKASGVYILTLIWSGKTESYRVIKY